MNGAAGITNGLGRDIGGGRIVIEDNDLGAFLGIAFRNRCPDAGCPARHRGAMALQEITHIQSPPLVVWSMVVAGADDSGAAGEPSTVSRD